MAITFQNGSIEMSGNELGRAEKRWRKRRIFRQRRGRPYRQLLIVLFLFTLIVQLLHFQFWNELDIQSLIESLLI